jgi:hypothetical protein
MSFGQRHGVQITQVRGKEQIDVTVHKVLDSRQAYFAGKNTDFAKVFDTKHDRNNNGSGLATRFTT